MHQGVCVQAPNLAGLDSMDGTYTWRIFNASESGKALRIFSKIYSDSGRLLDQREWEQVLVSAGERVEHPVTMPAADFLKKGNIYFYEFLVQDGRTGPAIYRQMIPFRFLASKDRMQNVLSPQELEKKREAFAKPWRGNKLGIDHTVPPPWTPVSWNTGTAGVWQRSYRLSDGILPVGIEALGKEILAAPVRLMLAPAEGQPVDMGRIPFICSETNDDAVLFRGELKKAAWDVRVTAAVEFDGMMRFDYSLAPEKALDIKELYLEIPVRRQSAIYTHYIGERWEGCYAGFLPEKGLKIEFKRQVWVGDEDRGLAWFAPSMKGWNNSRPDVISVTAQGDAVVIRVNLIDHAVKLDKPLETTFGLQATPVKPRPADWRQWQQFKKETGPVPASRKYYGQGHMWRYGTGFSTPVPGDPVYFRKEVERVHGENTLAIPYASPAFMGKLKVDHPATASNKYEHIVLMNEFTDEYALFGDLWRVMPPKDWGNAIAACPHSEWTDYIVWAVNDMLEKYGIDGMYFDCAWVDACQNEKHGCGYRDARGDYCSQFNIFEQREMKKRIYKLFKQKARPTLIIDHLSAMLDAPLISFCDIGFNGEQVSAGPKDNYYDLFTLDKMRAEFTGRQWGFIPMIMSMFKTDMDQMQKHPESSERFFGLVLLHDVLYGPAWINTQAYKSFARVYIEFGVFDADFLPYWLTPLGARADSPDVKISAYVKKGKALLIVGNVAPVEKTVKVTVEKQAVGFQKLPGAAVDLFHGGSFALDANGSLTLPIKAYNFRALQIVE